MISGENNPTLDAGLFEYASIGDFAWLDINANGSQDTGDTGIVNIKVVLTGTDNTGIEVTKSTTTLADGSYLFCLLYTSPSPRDLSTSRMPSSA